MTAKDKSKPTAPTPPQEPITFEGIDERRAWCFRLKMLGFSHTQIAGMVGVDKSTVSRDLTHLADQMAVKLQPKSAQRILCDALMRYEVLLNYAMTQYTNSVDGTIPKMRAMEIALNANTATVKLLQDTGIMKRIPQVVALPADHPALAGMGQDARIRIGEGLRRFFDLFQSKMADGTLDVTKLFGPKMLGTGDGEQDDGGQPVSD